jgi:hypothetical protein
MPVEHEDGDVVGGGGVSYQSAHYCDARVLCQRHVRAGRAGGEFSSRVAASLLMPWSIRKAEPEPALNDRLRPGGAGVRGIGPERSH